MNPEEPSLFLTILSSSYLSNALGILGASLTIWTLRQVSYLRKGFMKKARLPSLHNELLAYIESAERLTNPTDMASESFYKSIICLKANLTNISEKVDGDLKKTIDKWIDKANSIRSKTIDESIELVSDLQEIQISVSYHMKDENWNNL
ncbi:hypothetical protein [Limnobaculum xujianqingii]|uniref:hypothetical protein n=1 Tax=Limnobaculum xujianqingii TaxID=2738837 RepID=UPI0015BDD035|nr:hypothetical protein [Limnobaculum xujianqingii]